MAIFSKDQPPAQNPANPSPAVKGDRPSYFGPNVAFDGTLSGSEDVVIDGLVKGVVNLGSDLRIAGNGRVEASVKARNVLIEGMLTGDCEAEQRIELVSSARVDGNIKAPKIIVAEGARFRGAVDMGTEKPKA